MKPREVIVMAKVVILAPISNKYISYFDVVQADASDEFLIFILKRHRPTYPDKLNVNVKLICLEQWNEPFIDFAISKYFGKKSRFDFFLY